MSEPAVKRRTILNRIRKEEYFFTYSDKKSNRYNHSNYLIWITNPGKIKDIVDERNKKHKIQQLELIISREILFNICDQGIIDRKTLDTLFEEKECTKYHAEIISQGEIWDHITILKIKPLCNSIVMD